ncbi:hypothetical protein M5J07_21680 [Achromobacter mucicolens]|uniref:hypothetical protein n=1 Tax=Achromobacter mucicolens TaxID=1389922 RepID=UPI0020A38B24|nr:hypothetical protein [Achromobacter mucicolens]MCP2517563.1 hypothetical protein [Achromobacter mucicolens]
MKRLLVVLLLLFGGFTAEAAKPFQCQLISNSRPRRDPLPPGDRQADRIPEPRRRAARAALTHQEGIRKWTTQTTS